MKATMQRRPVLLLELFLSFTLITLLIAFLFSSYRELGMVTSRVRSCKLKILPQYKVQLRLKQIFSKLTRFSRQDEEHYLLMYNSEIDLDPHFRGQIMGLLHLEKGTLYLTTWPQEGSRAFPRHELLASQIPSLSFSFFDEEKREWSEEYPKTKPFMMKITLGKTVMPLFL